MANRRRAGRSLVLAITLLSSCPALSRPQSILTVAGGGDDDGRPALRAALRVPFGLATRGAGEVVIADSYDHRIRLLDLSTGLLRDVAGNGTSGSAGDGGPATRAGLSEPETVAVDGSGNLLVADTGNSLVRLVDLSTGTITTVVGVSGDPVPGFAGDGGPATAARLSFPRGIAVDASGNLYVADTRNHRVRVVDGATRRITTLAGTGTAGWSGDGGPAAAARLSSPRGLLLDGAGGLLVADSGNNVVRRIALAGRTIETVAGTGTAGFSGDGGDARAARLSDPRSLSRASNGDLLVADAGNGRVRRIRAADGTIVTIAGTGEEGFGGDGGPATAAAFFLPSGVAGAPNGVVFVADTENNRVRAIGLDGVVATLAGSGTRGLVGDGGPATSAGLAYPSSVDVSAPGSTLVADTYNHRVRRVDRSSGVITTVAGAGRPGFGGDEGPATEALLNYPHAVVREPGGDLLVADTENHRVRRVEAATGRIRTIAGNGTAGFGGDGGPATAASLNGPVAVLVDGDGGVVIADTRNHRVRRVDRTTGVITTLAGTGLAASTGDGGPATSAALDLPSGLAFDGAGGLLVSETHGHRVRRVVLATGLIGTMAGSGTAGFGGDGGAATSALLAYPWGLATDADGNVLIADTANARVRRVERTTGRIATVAGSRSGYSGDEGPASSAGMSEPRGVAVDASGDLFVSDTKSNRVRAVFACRNVGLPSAGEPAEGATVDGRRVAFTWGAVPGAFRYELLLDTVVPPARVAASDLGTTTPSPVDVPPGTQVTYSVPNLVAGTTWFWRAVAKGDPFCPSPSTASSPTRSFATATGCTSPGAFALLSPPDGGEGVAPNPTLAWQPAPGAGTYDVYLGPSNPPGLAASGVAATSWSAAGLAPGSVYWWSVAAHAACDPAKTSASPMRSFRVAGSCAPPAAVAPLAPADGASGLGAGPTLSWTASAGASGYDLYFGRAADPPLYLAGLTATSAALSGLAPGATYWWRVVARTSCESGGTTTFAPRSFTVAGACSVPGAPALTSVPSGAVGTGQTYVVGWSAAPGLDAGGGYVVERSLDAAFPALLDAQATTERSASFLAPGAGRVWHRVRAVAGCDPSRVGPASAARSVDVVAARPNVVFSVLPTAVLTKLGDKLEERESSFTVENIGTVPVQVLLSRQEIASVPFFRVVDPLGGDATFVTLAPRQPRSFVIRYSGPPNDRAGTYQGLVVLSAAGGAGLAVTPWAFVSLKVGGSSGAVPEFRAGGVRTEYASFPGLSGDDAARDPISVDVANPGDEPMEVGTEIGPEVWLQPESGWNAAPIPPRAARTVRLFTRRDRAPDGSALPRYTYLTLRTSGGGSARLLVQDNDAPALGPGRTSTLAPGDRSYVVPSVVRAASRIGNVFVSRLGLGNTGTEPVQAELLFTPRDADGFSSEVKRATVVVPPNDVVSLTNPLVQLFGYPPDANVSGQLEVRVPRERVGFLTVDSTVDAPSAEGGSFGFRMPTVLRGEGAKAGRPVVVPGVAFTARRRTNLVVAETTGLDHVVVRASLFGADGLRKGDAVLDVPRNGQKQVAVTDLGATEGLEGGQVELSAEAGGGAAAGLVTVIDNTNDDAVTYVGRPASVATGAGAPGFLERTARRPIWAKATGTVKSIVPALVNGYRTFRDADLPYTFQSLVGLTSISSTAATFRLSFRDLNTGETTDRTVVVPGRSTVEYANVLEELFGIPAGQKSQGPLFVESDPNGLLYCKVYSILQSGTLGDSFPVVPIPSENLSGQGSAKPLYVDGLEQSVDATRGTRSNLILNEVTGIGTAQVSVRLYEAGNRSAPIAETVLSLSPGEKRQLSTVFSGLGLETAERLKDRTNVLCVVETTAGDGLASAVVTRIDNRTGDTKNILLTPAGGVSSSPGVAIGF